MSDNQPKWQKLPETELMKAARQVLVALSVRRADLEADEPDKDHDEDVYQLHNIETCANLLRNLIEALEG